jgi:outer membrane protein assembly factor BamD (BamD/ComL family)
MMRILMRCSVLALLLAATGCSGDGGQRLYETAQFEEKQNNADHAAKLYQEIVAKHPDSPYAAKAAERLAQLGKR